jgi:hypothetical protein
MPEGVTTPVPKAHYLLDGEAFQRIYGEEERAAVAGLADVYAPLQTADSVANNPNVLAGVEVIRCAGMWLGSLWSMRSTGSGLP